MKKLYFTAFIAYLLLIPNLTARSGAGDSPTEVRAEEPVTLERLLEDARKNNPEIKALGQKFLASKQWPLVARTWEYPQVGYEKKEREEMFSLYQTFPFPGKPSARGAVAEHESEIARQELNAKTREILAEVKKSYWNYWLVHKTIEIYLENLGIMKRFLTIAKTRYAVGKVTQIDILKANTELAEMENALIMLEQEKISVQAELNALLNRSPETPLDKPAQPKKKEAGHTREELENISLKNRPGLLSKRSSYNRSAAGLNLAKREWFPDIMGGAKTSNMGGQTYMFQTSLPIYFWKQGSIVRAAKKEKEMAGWDLQSAESATIRAVKDLWAKYDAHRKSVGIYETSIVPLAEQTIAITESGYRAGKNDFLDLLDSQKRYLSYNIDYYRRVAETQIYLIELEKIAGVDF